MRRQRWWLAYTRAGMGLALFEIGALVALVAVLCAGARRGPRGPSGSTGSSPPGTKTRPGALEGLEEMWELQHERRRRPGAAELTEDSQRGDVETDERGAVPGRRFRSGGLALAARLGSG